MKKAKKPRYKLGVIHAGEDVITVKKIYPPGHKYASKKEYGYLVDCTDRGEDELLEHSLGRLISTSM